MRFGVGFSNGGSKGVIIYDDEYQAREIYVEIVNIMNSGCTDEEYEDRLDCLLERYDNEVIYELDECDIKTGSVEVDGEEIILVNNLLYAGIAMLFNI